MSNTFILVDEALLSRLKEFVIKEISLSHTLQDQSASTRLKRMGHPAHGLTKEREIQSVVILRGWGIQSADVLRGWDFLSAGPLMGQDPQFLVIWRGLDI